ncbi:MAG: hypothetical protein NWF05_06200 [Candidatus Bathyarchaeota archaeon]|nr:hypothetical protein [Candidatus Bathyarchaeota archaeon]
MNKSVVFGAILVLLISALTASVFVPVMAADETSTEWIKNLGEFSLGTGNSLIQTSDEGYAIAGGKNGGFLLLKANSSGYVEWEKTYGTDADFQSFATAIVEADDGGYVLAGQGTPWPNFIGPNGTLFNLLKTDASGNMQWSRNFSTEETPFLARSLIKTSDEGYVVAGYAETGHTIMGSGTGYICLVKTDPAGNLQWKQLIEADAHWASVFIAVVETADGGYALLSVADFTEQAVPTVENVDFLLIKTDSEGAVQWNKTYGGPYNERPCAFIETADGGYLLGGATMQNYTSGSSVFFQDDAWLVKTDSEGNMLWNKTYGDDAVEDAVNSVLETQDGGYVAAVAIDASSKTSLSGTSIIKLDTSGNTEWTNDYLNSTQPSLKLIKIIEVGENSYVSAGVTPKVDVSDSFSVVLVKLRAPSQTSPYPSPSIPEFPAWLILTFLAAASICALHIKTKLAPNNSRGNLT